MAYTTIDDPSQYFQTALWSGDNATTQNITNDGNSDLQPDWVWVKCRNTAGNGFSHNVHDTSRGVDNNVNKSLFPDVSDQEGGGDTITTSAQLGGVSAMLSDGFTVREGSIDNDSRYVNESTRTYVGWQWKVNGGSTTTNDASSTGVGSIDSVYQVNTTAGISIVTYTGAGGNQTVAHGLGSVPEIIFAKRRDAGGDWTSFHEPIGNTKFLRLNANIAAGTQSTYWQDTDPTSTVFSVGNAGDVNTSSGTHVAYCMKSVQGFSKFGKYIGNGNTDGPFIYTGFKPAWLMIKETGNANEWRLFDNKRNEHNPVTTHFEVDTDGAETDGGTTHNQYNFLSNGFKIRTSNAGNNRDGGQYIYMCFAESPIVSSEGVPNTAR